MTIMYIPPDDSAVKAISLWRQSEEQTATRLLEERKWKAQEALLRDQPDVYERVTGFRPQTYNPGYEEAQGELQQAKSQLEQLAPPLAVGALPAQEEVGKSELEKLTIAKNALQAEKEKPFAGTLDKRAAYLAKYQKEVTKAEDSLTKVKKAFEATAGTRAAELDKKKQELLKAYEQKKVMAEQRLADAQAKMGDNPEFFSKGYGYNAKQLNDWYETQLRTGDPATIANANRQMVQAMINNKTVHQRPAFDRFDYLGLGQPPTGDGGKNEISWTFHGPDGKPFTIMAPEGSSMTVLRRKVRETHPLMADMKDHEIGAILPSGKASEYVGANNTFQQGEVSVDVARKLPPRYVYQWAVSNGVRVYISKNGLIDSIEPMGEKDRGTSHVVLAKPFYASNSSTAADRAADLRTLAKFGFVPKTVKTWLRPEDVR